LRYGLAAACIGIAALLHVSPVGPLLHPTGPFVLGVVAAAWFGGLGPGIFAAFLAAVVLPHMTAITYSVSVAYPLVAGVFDLPRFVTLGLTGAAVGWAAGAYRRAAGALHDRERQLSEARNELEAIGAERTARLAASEERHARAGRASQDGMWEARFHTLTALSSDFFWETDVEHRYTIIEPGRAYTGVRNHASKLGLARWEIPYASPDEAAWAAHRAAIAARERFVDFRFSRIEEGAERFYEHSGEPRYDAQGTFLGYRGVGRDITARKRAEEALRESEQRYELAMAASESGYWDWHIPTDRYFASPRAHELSGFPPGHQWVNRADYSAHIPMHPEDFARWEAARKELFAGTGERLSMEVRYIVHGETRWHILHAICRRDGTGKVVRWSGSATDITDRKLAADELRGSEARFRALTALSSDWYWEQDENLRFVYMSDQASVLGGYTAPLSIGKTRWELEGLSPLSCTWAEHQAVLAARQAFRDLELRRVLPDGSVRYLSISGAPIFDDQGRFKGYQGVGRDVTERKRAEEALRRSEERYALAVAGSADGVWDVDFAARRMFVSARARELAGLPPGPESVPMDEYFAALPIHPEDVPRRDAALQAHLTGKTSAYEGEFRLRQLDGAYRWRRLHGLCLRDANGNPYRMAGSISDVDARRRAEDALRLSEERYALAMEVAEEGHWDWNVRTDEIFASAQARRLVDVPQEMEYRTRSDIIARVRHYPDDWPQIAEKWRAALAGRGVEHEFEYRILRGEAGEPRWLRDRWKIFRDPAGAARRVMGVVADITERKLAADELRESEARFRGLTAVWSDWYWRQDENLRYTYSSADTDPPEGYPGGSAIGKARWDLPGIVPLSSSWAEHQALLAARKPFRDFEHSRPAPDGTMRYMSTSGAPIFDAKGEFRGYHGVARNITELKRAVNTLRESEARFRRMTELSADTYWEQDENLRYTQSGPGQDIAGYVTDVNQGKTRWELCGEAKPLSSSWEEHQAVLAAHQPFRDFEYRRLRPDGTSGYYSASGAPMFDAEGRFRGYQGVARDITERKRFEEELRSRKEMLELAQKAARAVPWEWWNGAYPEVNRWSPELSAMFGLSPEAFDGTVAGWRRLCHPDDWPRVKSSIAHAHATGEIDVEYRVIHPDGKVRWLNQKGRTLFGANGKPERSIGFMLDVTERKEAETALRESEARFRSLTELSSDWYWQQDENLRFVNYEPAEVGTRSGVAAASSLGKTRWEFDNVTPLSSTWEEHKAVLAARQPFRDFEYVRLDEHGTPHYTVVSGVPTFDVQGRFTGYQGVGRNVSERRRFEGELRSRQEMLDLAQKAARAIAFEWRIGEGEGENRWSSDLEAMYGFAPGTYDGTFETWRKRVHPEDWPAVKEAILHAHRTGDVASEYRVVHPDGSVHWLQAKGRMFFGPDGKPGRMVGFMQDVTDRKQAEDELRKMEQELRRAQRLEAIGTLAGGIAHDFNNILGAILGYGEMAMRDARTGTRLHRDLDSIMAAGERGRALVDRILAFSRSGAGEHVPVHVEAIVREALDQVAASLPEHVTITPRLSAGRAAMLGDSTQVHQVVMNLASNAVQAMPQGGELRVALETARFDAVRPATVGSILRGDYIVLGVSDTGTGIPDDVLERMFDPFFTTKEVGVGTGLGLSLVHGIVTSVDGAIDVATARGKGTTFTVYLRRSGDATEGPTDDSRPLPHGEGQRVLVVDDEETLVRLATETLERLGYAPVAFTSSTAALAAFRADPERFDAVLTDERMPGLTGSALIREVRGIRAAIPVVLMSGYLGMESVDANVVVRKPLSTRDLATSLARVLHVLPDMGRR
jgi:PAS domain S-box-containing protein